MAEVLRCRKHPSRETVLRCGKCDAPICWECAIQTPVGARCADCAQMRPPPEYEVLPRQYARAAFSGFLMSAAMGVICLAFLRGIPFSIFLSPIIAGLAIGEAIHRASNYKRGAGLRWLAVGMALLSAFLGEAFVWGFSGIALAPGLMRLDILSILIYVGVASYVATTRL
jgi:hypothetical protein